MRVTPLVFISTNLGYFKLLLTISLDFFPFSPDKLNSTGEFEQAGASTVFNKFK